MNFLLMVLIGQLDSECYHTRVRAEAQLKRLEWPHILWVEHLGKTHRSAEVRQRCKIIARRFFDVRPTKSEKIPWISNLDVREEDGYLLNQPSMYLDYLNRVREKYPTESYDIWREATSLYVDDLLRKGISRKTVIFILDQLMERELNFHKKNKQNYRWRD